MKLSKTLAISIATVAVSAMSASAAMMMPSQNCSYSFSQNLKMGSKGMEVMNLQKVLNMYPQTMVASTGSGSMGMETMKFGPATKAAVIKFQMLNASDVLTPAGLTRGTGNVYALTRAALNQICKGGVSINPVTPVPGCTSTTMYSPVNGQMCPVSNGNTGTVNTGTGVISNNIPVSVLVQGQAGAKLAEFVVSGNGAVSNITLQRIGLANNSTLANVYLYDGMTRLTDASSPRTDGSISFNSTAGLFFVNGSKTITVRADIQLACTSTNTPVGCGNTSGQTVGVAFTSMTMAGGSATPVSGANGALFAISSANTATANFTNNAVTVNPFVAVNTVYTINPGSVNQTLWSDSISIGINPVKFNGMTFKMVGSAPSNALANVQLYIDGVSVGTASIDSMNKFVFNMMSSPKMLTTGSHLIELRADVVAGANRSFYMTIERGTDIRIEDSVLAGISTLVTSAGNELINANAGTITINTGSLTVTQDTAFNNVTTLVGGASQVKLAAYKMTSYGEDVKVTTLTFTPSFTSMAPANNTFANVGLYVNGGQVGSNQTATHGTALVFSGLGSNVYVAAGTPISLEVRGDVMNSSSVAYTAGTVKFDLAAGVSNAQGISSSNVTSTSAAGGQTLTIGNNVTFGATSGFAASTKAPNSVGVKIGSFSIQTGSAEGITVNNISVTLPVLGNTMQPASQLTNLTIKDGSTVVGTPIGNPVLTNSNAFSAQLTVSPSTTKVFDIYGDFGSGSAGQTVTPSLSITYRGNTSNLSQTTSVVAGSTTTSGAAVIVAGGVTFNTGLSPVAQVVTAGQTAFNIGTFNFKVNNSIGGAIIKDVTFTVPANTITTITMNGKTASVVGTTATIYNVGATVPADASGVNLPVTVGLVCVGTANGCSANSLVTVNAQVVNVTYNDGNTTQAVVTTPVTNSHFISGSKPVYTVNSTQQTGFVLGAENKIGEVTISADAAGQIKVNNIAFNLATSGITAPVFSAARIADGNTTISGSSVSSGCTAVGACVMTFGASPNGYTIAAGTSKTFSLYATVAGTPIASTVVSVSSSVTPATTTWDDAIGGGTSLPSSNIYNFPTASYSIRQ